MIDMQLARNLPLRLNSRTRTFATGRFSIDPRTAALSLLIRRPTTARPVAWGDADTMQTAIVITIDGQDYSCMGQVSGGIQRDRSGVEIPAYQLVYRLPIMRHGNSVRYLGETGDIRQARVEITLLSGRVDTEILLAETRVGPVLTEVIHNSVAYDTASSIIEMAGDGTVTLSHTASGSNRAAFIGIGHERTNTASTHTAPTYAGNSSTSIWNANTFYTGQRYSAHYVLETAVPTGSQTVSSVLSGGAGSLNSHALGVITMTGVHQTTPIGTPANSTASTGTTPSVTVGSVTAEDLVVDLIFAFLISGSLTIGANQTARWTQQSGSTCFSGSTQSGVDGGVMSWSKNVEYEYAIGAVAFKAAAVATGPPAGSLALLGVGR